MNPLIEIDGKGPYQGRDLILVRESETIKTRMYNLMYNRIAILVPKL